MQHFIKIFNGRLWHFGSNIVFINIKKSKSFIIIPTSNFRRFTRDFLLQGWKTIWKFYYLSVLILLNFYNSPNFEWLIRKYLTWKINRSSISSFYLSRGIWLWKEFITFYLHYLLKLKIPSIRHFWIHLWGISCLFLLHFFMSYYILQIIWNIVCCL